MPDTTPRRTATRHQALHAYIHGHIAYRNNRFTTNTIPVPTPLLRALNGLHQRIGLADPRTEMGVHLPTRNALALLDEWDNLGCPLIERNAARHYVLADVDRTPLELVKQPRKATWRFQLGGPGQRQPLTIQDIHALPLFLLTGIIADKLTGDINDPRAVSLTPAGQGLLKTWNTAYYTP